MSEGTRPPSPALTELAQAADSIRAALAEVVVGQQHVIDQMLVGLMCGGHILLEGVPGVAKTLLARCLTSALGLEFRRVQFTPDLTPADITGTNVFDFQKGAFHLQRGPVFTNVLLADEINRTPPKTQAALLEAMEERQVTIDGVSHPLANPFFVIATQNPLEHEGTYPLPEAQLDRFLLKVVVTYPAPAEEIDIYQRFLDGRLQLSAAQQPAPSVIERSRIPLFRQALLQVHVEPKVLEYLQAIVAATRNSPSLSLGASPRAGMALLAAVRARAALDGRDFVTPDDIKALAAPVLRHRLIVTPEAELDGATSGDVLARVLDGLEVPR